MAEYITCRQLKKYLQNVVPDLQLCEIVFVWDIAELEQKHKVLFDLHYSILYTMQSIMQNRGQTHVSLNKQLRKFVGLYEEVEALSKKIGQHNGRAIVVCNKKQQRDAIMAKLSMNECKKYVTYFCQLLGLSSQKGGMIADSVSEPEEIIWKYVGESSARKIKVRIQTTAIGLGFLLLAFSLLYFPIVKINVANIIDKSLVSTILSLATSIMLQILAIGYRVIIIKLVPKRRPSSRDSQSYFVVMATVIFHFLFYLVVPITYYMLDLGGIPRNLKLKQLFIAVLTCLFMTVLIAILDIKHRIFNRRRQKLVSEWRWWGQYCQARLHELLSWPAFPIQFKLMVLLNILSFNAYYTFQIPYLLLVFVAAITIIYWVDKRNLYKHYKMQAYLSIGLEISVHRDYVFFFLLCACCGYVVSAVNQWQYIVAAAMFVISMITNSILNYHTKREELRQLRMSRTMTLAQARLLESINIKSNKLTLLDRLMDSQNINFNENLSYISLGSGSQGYGYEEIYNNYLHQFKRKDTREMLATTYRHCIRRLQNMNAQQPTQPETELAPTISDSARNDSLRSQTHNQSLGTTHSHVIHLNRSRRTQSLN